MLSENLRNLRKEKHLSLEQLADMVGTSRQTIHRYETGVISNIPPERIEALAEALDTTPSRLMGWKESDEPSSDNMPSGLPPSALNGIGRISAKRLPTLGNVTRGEPTFAGEDRTLCIKAGAGLNADFCLAAQGDSMVNARIFDGDILFVKQQETVEDGEIAVVLIDGETAVRRVYFDRENGILTLMPENPTYKPMRYTGSRLEHIRILGKVVSGQYKI